jgi:hypothetical protein
MGNKKKGKLITKAKYLPIQAVLSPEIAYAQAAFALDCAVQAAQKTDNAEQLSTASALWMELADRMGGIRKVDGQPPAADITSKQFGFSGPGEEEYAEFGDED